MQIFLRLVARAAMLTAGCVLFAVVFNAIRPNGIDLVAKRPYDIYVPCPETETETVAVSADQVAGEDDVVYLDARPEEDYRRAHIKGAISFPYPVLGEPSPERIEQLKQRGVPIVTYDSGGRDRMGEMMAALLTENQVPDVTHLEGGLEAWRERGGEIEGEGEPAANDAGPAGESPADEADAGEVAP